MLRDQDIICISSIDWDFVWQGHQEIMAAFARSGNRVLFIENTGVRIPGLNDIGRLKKRFINWRRSAVGFREEAANLYIYSPLILPFPYSRCAAFINNLIFLRPLKKWMKVMDFHNPVIWTFLPTGIALDLIKKVDKKIVVYYCIADFAELADPRKVSRTEKEIMKKSDLIFAQGEVLAKKCREHNDNVHIFPFGVNIETFDNLKLNGSKVPDDMKKIKNPVIGYIGGVHKHIDFGLLKFIAITHPEWSIVLVGPIQTGTAQIQGLPNIHLLGKKEFASLPYYINEFDVCIIPYDKTEYTNTVYPTKLNEYHALGKPVVSTDLPEVVGFNARNGNLVLTAKSREEFVSSITRALSSAQEGLIEKRVASARKNSWIARIEEMSALMEETIADKSALSLDWKEKFMKLYRSARRRTLKLAGMLMGFYLMIFYTPLAWWAASPLKISQPPRKADCIVVFAGGVGESGKAGQGYEERVQYAVELYKEGYAKHMVFSSGYTYVFKEPMIMKALALSLGVPDEAILLEQGARNTYENVKFSREIVKKEGWSSVILISSPYHMRRASLVFRKVAADIRVDYLPVPQSRFYSPGNREVSGRFFWKRINIRQLKSMLHEYAGIIYYWWKGYI